MTSTSKQLDNKKKDRLNIVEIEQAAPLVKEENDSSSPRKNATVKGDREQRRPLMRMRINLII